MTRDAGSVGRNSVARPGGGEFCRKQKRDCAPTGEFGDDDQIAVGIRVPIVEPEQTEQSAIRLVKP